VRTAVITGAGSGIGLALTRKLLLEGWRVVGLQRTAFPVPDAQIVGALQAGDLRFIHADLSDTSSLMTGLSAVRASCERIDALFNNAGIMSDGLQWTSSGREAHFEINVLAPYIVTIALRDLVALGDSKTILNTSSNSLLMVRDFDITKLEQPSEFKKLIGPYAKSKLALSLWSAAVAPTLDALGVRILSVDPGPTKTAMSAGPGMPAWLLPLRHLIFRSPARAADVLYDAAFHSKAPSGTFLLSGKRRAPKWEDQGPAVLKLVNALLLTSIADNRQGASRANSNSNSNQVVQFSLDRNHNELA